MHKTIKRLYRDHAHINQLVDILEQQLNQLREKGEANIDLLAEIADYLNDYADTIHHPIEDQLYQMMLAQADSGREPIEKLLSEHLMTVEISRKLRRTIDAMQQNIAKAREDVLQAGMECVEHQRQHMEYEEKEAFPTLRKELDDDAFDNAAAALPADKDPLGEDMKDRYPALFEHVTTQLV